MGLASPMLSRRGRSVVAAGDDLLHSPADTYTQHTHSQIHLQSRPQSVINPQNHEEPCITVARILPSPLIKSIPRASRSVCILPETPEMESQALSARDITPEIPPNQHSASAIQPLHNPAPHPAASHGRREPSETKRGTPLVGHAVSPAAGAYPCPLNIHGPMVRGGM